MLLNIHHYHLASRALTLPEYQLSQLEREICVRVIANYRTGTPVLSTVDSEIIHKIDFTKGEH